MRFNQTNQISMSAHKEYEYEITQNAYMARKAIKHDNTLRYVYKYN